MERKPDAPRALIALFLGFLALLGGLFWALPDRAFSEMENRALAQFPEFTPDALFHGDWTARFEAYAADQFPARALWVAAKAGSEYLLGRRENNGVYFGRCGMLLLDYRSSEKTLQNAQQVARFAQAAGVPVYFGLVPGSILLNQALLPAFSLQDDQAADIAAAYARMPGIDILSALRSQPDPAALYYSTDHHWTAQGAYAAYTAIAPALGLEALPCEAFARTVLSQSFYGTLHARSGAWWTGPDTIEGWSPRNTPAARTEVYEEGARILTLEGYFSEDRLSTRDQYAVFLDGNHARVVIRTGLGNAKRLLIIKDSYAHALAPLLAAHYEELHLADLRYFRTDFTQYIAAHGICEVLVLYGLHGFSTDGNLVFLNAGR